MLFKNITILDENFDIKENMYVAVQDGRIALVTGEEPEGDFGDVYDGRGRLLMPGFYNSHAHSPVSYTHLDVYKRQVIYDDIDIPTGSIRIRKKGSAGTHNGMRNILYQIQSEDFPRIRVGIGSGKQENLISYVTGGVGGDEKELLEDALTRAAEAAACIVEKGIEKAMNEYNVRPKKQNEAGDTAGKEQGT